MKPTRALTVPRAFAALVALTTLGCSQEGTVAIHNRSGSNLEVRMDGAAWLLDDGEVVTRQVEIGRKFLFGPDEATVLVSGEGDCKWPFEETVVVTDDRNALVVIDGDAGYFDVCNVSGNALELYLSPCASSTWGDPLEIVPDGVCTTWMVAEGCWDMRVVSIAGAFEDYDVYVAPCEVAAYDVETPALSLGTDGPAKAFFKAASGLIDVEARRTKKIANRDAE